MFSRPVTPRFPDLQSGPNVWRSLQDVEARQETAGKSEDFSAADILLYSLKPTRLPPVIKEYSSWTVLERR